MQIADRRGIDTHDERFERSPRVFGGTFYFSRASNSQAGGGAIPRLGPALCASRDARRRAEEIRAAAAKNVA